MQNNSRNFRASCLLGFLLLLLAAASRGMRLPRGNKPSWQDCKDASQEILSELWKLRLEEKEVVNTTVELPQRIECRDKCDPDSLDNNKMVGGNMESSSPALPPTLAPWVKQALEGPILLRLQSFAVVVARVISHCAALARNAN
ncbi:interleukin-23 subunit alpha-like [Zootoca vivipara]|uniref:interleukin-23 subunit alpha-like n=1 Tax=Zootoca vivipara TaxID=8524 RepID=UPI00293BB9F2|nr:interleukin-23 subunit alpha-like [Zootoca vivipara]